MSEVTGCIVTYNSIESGRKKKELENAIETILEFTKSVDFKLYIVDNNSGDGTADFVAKKYPQVKLIRNKKNIGFGAAHNKMLNCLGSKYHFVINPDIAFDSDVIGAMCSFMEENSEVGVTAPKICFPDGRLQVLARRNPKIKYLLASRFAKDREKNKLVREYCRIDEDITEPTQVENSSGCFLGFRSDVFRKLGGFDDRYFMYFEDFDLLRRANEITKIYYLPEVIVYHEWGRDSSRDGKLLKIHINSTLKYFFKWGL